MVWKFQNATILCIAVLFLSINPLCANEMDIAVYLSIKSSPANKTMGIPYYTTKDIITLQSEVINNSNTSYRVSENFISNCKGPDIILVSPLGNLLLPIKPYAYGSGYKSGVDNPPLGYVFYKGEFIQPVPCKKFQSGNHKKFESVLKGLDSYFNLALPGIYSVQFQVSAMIFKNTGFCAFDNLRWQGLLKSPTIYFFYEGETQINVNPHEWPISWTKYPDSPINVTVTFKNRERYNSIDKHSFRINAVNFTKDIIENESELSYSLVLKDSDFILKILYPYGDITIGKYPIVLYGKFVSGEPFGGAFLIEVLNK